VPTEELDEADELAAGAERDPVRFPRWLSVLAAAVAIAAAGYLALRPGDEAPLQGRPTSSASPSASAPLDVAPTGYPPLEGPMALAGQTCLTFGPGRLTFVLGLQNNTLAPVSVLSVSAHLPIGGLTPLGGQVPAERTCGGATVGDRSTTLNPADRIPVSLSFQRFDDCPAPYPVQVDVAVQDQAGQIRTQRIAVLADLGGYADEFPACDAAGQSSG
jgi:hypothetical protein